MDYEDFLEQAPIAKFSLYTHLQVNTVISLGELIKEQFDCMFQGSNTVDMSKGNPYGNIWLWVIATYEVVRTMSDPKWKTSWSDQSYIKILKYKKKIANIRVPFAKQEHRNGKAINAENSIYDIDFENNSYKYEINGNIINIRKEIDGFEDLIQAIKLTDVLSDLRSNQS